MGLRQLLLKIRPVSLLKHPKNRGSIITTLGITTAILGIALTLGNYVLNNQKIKKVVSNEFESRLLNSIVITRVAQAISSTAILCSHVTKLCYWNDSKNVSVHPDDFRFSNLKPSSAEGEPLSFDVEACLPSFSDNGVDLLSCENKISSVRVQIKDISELLGLVSNVDQTSGGQVGIISGALDKSGSLTDSDPYGLIISVASVYKDLSQEDKSLVSTAVVRRPRFFLRIETEDAFCAPTCQVSSLGDSESDSSFTGDKLKEGNVPKSQSFCLGKYKIVNNQSEAFVNSFGSTTLSGLSAYSSTKLKVPIRVWNDGPGFLYNYKIRRSFIPNPTFNFAVGQGKPFESEFISTFGQKGFSIPPGEKSDLLYDSELSCYDEKSNTSISVNAKDLTISGPSRDIYADVRNHSYDAGAAYKPELVSQSYATSVTTIKVSTASPSNPKPSGTVNYSYSEVEPANALALGVSSQQADATKTSTTQYTVQPGTVVKYVTPIILYNTGMN